MGVLDDSAGNQPPDLGPGLPLYPAINSFVRITGPAIVGTNIYPGLAQQPAQSSGLPVFRDRESVWLWEPNGIVLGPGYYDARLMGNHADLPLYATNCCVTAAFPSSSSSMSSSSAGPCIMVRTPLGTQTDTSGSGTITLSGISVQAGTLLLVGGAASFSSDPGAALMTATFGGTSMTRRVAATNKNGTNGDTTSWIQPVLFALYVPTTTTGDVVITWTITAINSALFATQASCVSQASNISSGGNSPPAGGSSVSCNLTISTSAEYAAAAIARLAAAGGDSLGTWSTGWSTGQTALVGTGGNAVSIEEGYYLNPPTGALSTGKTSMTARLAEIVAAGSK